MNLASSWVSKLLLLLPATLLLILAIPRFQSGRAVDEAFPVPTFIVMNVTLPQKSYRTAASTLSGANSKDGQTLIQLAEVDSYVRIPVQDVASLLQTGLAESPSSYRGWALLAEQLENSDKSKAAKAVALSLLLAPNDYFTAGLRARETAALWDELPADVQQSALRQARLLWSEKSLNQELLPLLEMPSGAGLLNRAFKNDPEELRTLNRWVAAQRRATAK